jgi:hypothetical protein
MLTKKEGIMKCIPVLENEHLQFTKTGLYSNTLYKGLEQI